MALAVAGALAFAVVDLRTDPATAVLAVARPVPAGKVITDADLTIARIVPDPAVALIAQSQRATVVGHTATVPLVAGTLLSPRHVGPGAWPPVGESVIAVAVKAGRAPAGLTVGSPVTVLVVQPAAGGSGGSKPVQASGAVVAVAPADASGVTVVSLLLASAAALQVSGASGDVSLILKGTGGS